MDFARSLLDIPPGHVKKVAKRLVEYDRADADERESGCYDGITQSRKRSAPIHKPNSTPTKKTRVEPPSIHTQIDRDYPSAHRMLHPSQVGANGSRGQDGLPTGTTAGNLNTQIKRLEGQIAHIRARTKAKMGDMVDQHHRLVQKLERLKEARARSSRASTSLTNSSKKTAQQASFDEKDARSEKISQRDDEEKTQRSMKAQHAAELEVQRSAEKKRYDTEITKLAAKHEAEPTQMRSQHGEALRQKEQQHGEALRAAKVMHEGALQRELENQRRAFLQQRDEHNKTCHSEPTASTEAKPRPISGSESNNGGLENDLKEEGTQLKKMLVEKDQEHEKALKSKNTKLNEAIKARDEATRIKADGWDRVKEVRLQAENHQAHVVTHAETIAANDRKIRKLTEQREVVEAELVQAQKQLAKRPALPTIYRNSTSSGDGGVAILGISTSMPAPAAFPSQNHEDEMDLDKRDGGTASPAAASAFSDSGNAMETDSLQIELGTKSASPGPDMPEEGTTATPFAALPPNICEGTTTSKLDPTMTSSTTGKAGPPANAPTEPRKDREEREAREDALRQGLSSHNGLVESSRADAQPSNIDDATSIIAFSSSSNQTAASLFGTYIVPGQHRSGPSTRSDSLGGRNESSSMVFVGDANIDEILAEPSPWGHELDKFWHNALIQGDAYM